MSEQIARHIIRLQADMTEKLFAAGEAGVSEETRRQRMEAAKEAMVERDRCASENAASLALAYLEILEGRG